ncbi:MAG: HAD-IIB family hydrolase [Cyclonatronaceae bacterium]
MIKLFVLDLDGCVSMPFEIPEWDALRQLRELNDASRQDRRIPPITICSGRPQPYVEAVGQWLGVYQPLIFESGGGMFDPRDVSLHWPPELDDHAEAQIAEIRKWVDEEVLSAYEGTVSEFTKRTDVGIIHREEAVINEIYQKVNAKVKADFPAFEAHFTEISINIIMKAANKGSGLRWLARKTGISTGEIAYIGDSGGDIPALKEAGMAFAPANARLALKRLPGIIPTKSPATRGVIEAYKHIIEANQS